MKSYESFFLLHFVILVNAWSLAFSPDGQYLATGSYGGKVDLYNAETGQKEMTLDTQTKFVLTAIYVKKIHFIEIETISIRDFSLLSFHRVRMEN